MTINSKPIPILPIVVGLSLLHIFLACVYASITPYRTPGLVNHAVAQDIGAPDERQHANYVQNLLEGKGLPIFSPEATDAYESYENHQPPLYYLMLAAWSKAVGVNDVATPGMGMRLRTFSALIGGGTVAGVFFLGFWGFERRDVALLAGLFASLLPMLAAIDGSVGNDALLFCLSTWTLAACALGLRQGWNWRRVIAIAVLCGLAILTKSSAVALLPIVLYAALANSSSRATLAQIGVAIFIVAMLIAPWWLRNQRLYGDPLAIGAFNRAFVGSPTPSMFIPVYGMYGYWVNWVGWWTARSFFGVFGYMDVFLGDTLYRVLIASGLVVGLGWFLSLKQPEWAPAKRVQILNVAFFAITLAMFARFNTQYFQAQARYLFPAIGPISIGLSIGLLTWTKGRWAIAATGLAVVLVGVNAYAVSVLPDKFLSRTIVSEVNLTP